MKNGIQNNSFLGWSVLNVLDTSTKYILLTKSIELIVSGWNCLQLLDRVDFTFTDLSYVWKGKKTQVFSIPNLFPNLN